MTDVAGREADDRARQLPRRKIRRAYSKTVKKGRVISQKPQPGTVLPKRRQGQPRRQPRAKALTMHLRKLLTLVFAAAVALLGATGAQPTPGSSGVRLLRTATGVTRLAADGSVAAVATACGA